MIKEISIAGLNNDPIKVKKPNIPQSDNKDLPRFFFNMLLVAQKHSGKTFLLAKLIKNYQKTKILDNDGNMHKIRVILFAPTAFSESNKIYETLNVDPDDIHVNYSDDQLLNVLDEIKDLIDSPKIQKKRITVRIVEKKFLDNMIGEDKNHQGLCLLAKKLEEISIYDFVARVRNKERVVIACLDQVLDPHNIGAILESMELL